MKNFRYKLRKGSKKEFCPNCKKKTFTPYISVVNGEIANIEKYGICDRKNNCAYLMYPPSEESDYVQWVQPEPKPFERIEPDFIPRGTMERTFRNYEQNVFVQYLRKMFGADKTLDLISDYNIGSSKGGGTIFWQVDRNNNVRTGKIIYYGENGKRLKDKNSWYIHNRIKPNFSLQQVLFGIHLTSKDKPVALIESEKSSIMMAAYYPDITFVASGGSNMLSIERLSMLPRLDYVYADEGMTSEWEKKVKGIFPDAKIDMRVEKAFLDGILEKGDDIIDLELIERQKINAQ
jgi:hypothetical protein